MEPESVENNAQDAIRPVWHEGLNMGLTKKDAIGCIMANGFQH